MCFWGICFGVTPASPPWHAAGGGVGGIMASKSRTLRPKRTQKKRASKRAAGKARKRSVKTAAPGSVETALAAVAHEVRTPLTGILAISDLLATSGLDERERRWVDTIRAGAEHLASLATLFVDAAKGGHSGFGTRQHLFDFRTLARNVWDSLSGRATAKGLQSQVEISEKLPSFVIGDPVRLRAALENLIDNAVKFTEQGGVALTASSTRSAQRRDQAPVPPVLPGQCQHRLAFRRRRPWTVLGQAVGARHGR